MTDATNMPPRRQSPSPPPSPSPVRREPTIEQHIRVEALHAVGHLLGPMLGNRSLAAFEQDRTQIARLWLGLADEVAAPYVRDGRKP